MVYFVSLLCCEVYGAHRDLHVRTHAFPSRRSSDLALVLEPGDGLRDARRFFGGGGGGGLGAQGIVDAAHAVPAFGEGPLERQADLVLDRKSTRLNSSH